MHVSTILAQKGNAVYTVEPGQMLTDTASLLAKNGIGSVVVVDAGKDICGILSERDIVHALASDGTSAMSRPVKDYMSKDVVTCTAEDSINHLMELMTKNRIRHLPVVEAGRLNGIVSIGDVVKCRIAEAEAESDALKAYIATG